MSRFRLAASVGIVAALVVLFFVVRPETDEGSSAPTGSGTTARTTTTRPTTTAAPRPQVVRARIHIRGGRPIGGIVRIDARRGQRVSLRVSSDTADRVHVHGYDLFADVAPGKPAVLNFNARWTGRFEIELEDVHRQVAQLRVTR